MKHPRNVHQDSYPLEDLTKCYPKLQQYILTKPNAEKTIDFANPDAVKALNASLLAHYYQIEHWDIPKAYLCPPVPGRADYVHYLADLLALGNDGQVPTGKTIKGIDIGTGANLIYPIIANRVYGWQMVGTDIDAAAVQSANAIIKSNPVLQGHINIRQQAKPQHIFAEVIKADETFDFCMCNPPFHQSAEQAQAGTQRKKKNLAKSKAKRGAFMATKVDKHQLNFAGQANELWCAGGELQFIQTMIKESVAVANQIGWFTSLVSKKDNLALIYKALHQQSVTEVKTINMAQGQKVSRFVAWRF
jgi:23S rRNA (adenine1618-N6)-methyltransferase